MHKEEYKMDKTYETPEIEIVSVSTDDIMTGSPDDQGPTIDL